MKDISKTMLSQKKHKMYMLEIEKKGYIMVSITPHNTFLQLSEFS